MTEPDQAVVRAFRPPIGLQHRHVQSILGGSPLRGHTVRRGARYFVKASRARVLDCGSGVRLGGLVAEHPEGANGIVVVLHGWEGSVESNYMLSVGSRLFASNFDVFRLNFRDHGATHALNEGLFHSCRLDEVVGAVRAIAAERPGMELSIVGYSLGGNFALRVAAAAAFAGLALRRVIAVCPVLRPHSTMRALDEGLSIYRHYFLRKWRNSLLAKARAFPDIYEFGDLRRFTTLTAMTDYFVRRHTPYETLDDYLSGYSIVGPALERLTVRSTVIATRDDPVIPFADLSDLARSPALDIRVEQFGGHCAFLDTFALSSWLDSVVAAELSADL